MGEVADGRGTGVGEGRGSSSPPPLPHSASALSQLLAWGMRSKGPEARVPIFPAPLHPGPGSVRAKPGPRPEETRWPRPESHEQRIQDLNLSKSESI